MNSPWASRVAVAARAMSSCALKVEAAALRPVQDHSIQTGNNDRENVAEY
jgi:hypothetical protein